MNIHAKKNNLMWNTPHTENFKKRRCKKKKKQVEDQAESQVKWERGGQMDGQNYKRAVRKDTGRTLGLKRGMWRPSDSY